MIVRVFLAPRPKLWSGSVTLSYVFRLTGILVASKKNSPFIKQPIEMVRFRLDDAIKNHFCETMLPQCVRLMSDCRPCELADAV